MGQYLIDTNTAIDFLDDKLPERSKRACGQVGKLKLNCPNVRRYKLLIGAARAAYRARAVELLTNAQKVSVSRNKTGRQRPTVARAVQ